MRVTTIIRDGVQEMSFSGLQISRVSNIRSVERARHEALARSKQAARLGSISAERETRGDPLPCSRICFAEALMRRCFARVLLKRSYSAKSHLVASPSPLIELDASFQASS